MNPQKLSPAEKNIILKDRSSSRVKIGFFTLLAIGMTFFLFKEMGLHISSIFFATIDLALIISIFWSYFSDIKRLENDRKILIKGILKKEIGFVKVQRQKVEQYFFIVSREKYQVDRFIFNKFHSGDFVNIYKSKDFGVLLDISVEKPVIQEMEANPQDAIIDVTEKILVQLDSSPVKTSYSKLTPKNLETLIGVKSKRERIFKLEIAGTILMVLTVVFFINFGIINFSSGLSLIIFFPLSVIQMILISGIFNNFQYIKIIKKDLKLNSKINYFETIIDKVHDLADDNEQYRIYLQEHTIVALKADFYRYNKDDILALGFSIYSKIYLGLSKELMEGS